MEKMCLVEWPRDGYFKQGTRTALFEHTTRVLSEGVRHQS